MFRTKVQNGLALPSPSPTVQLTLSGEQVNVPMANKGLTGSSVFYTREAMHISSSNDLLTNYLGQIFLSFAGYLNFVSPL